MKTINLLLCLFFVFSTTGCVSTWNHKRVVENEHKKFIMLHGTEKQKAMVHMGVSAKQAVALTVQENDNVVTAKIMFNVADFSGLQGYFKSYGEAPISSTFSLVADAAAAYVAYETAKGGGSWSIDFNFNFINNSDNSSITVEKKE